MQKLYLGKGNKRPQYGSVLLAQLRRIWTIRRVSSIRGCSMLLVTLSVWPKSGTVVPHRVFQKVIREIGLYKGRFLYTHPRSACRRAPPPMGSITTMVPAQLTEYYILQSFRVLKPLAAFSRFA